MKFKAESDFQCELSLQYWIPARDFVWDTNIYCDTIGQGVGAYHQKLVGFSWYVPERVTESKWLIKYSYGIIYISQFRCVIKNLCDKIPKD